MKQIPFLALPRGEQHALLGALRQAGVKLPAVCASRQELEDGPQGDAMAWITVTGAGWCRSYVSRPGWEGDLALDLLAR
ncbi:MAG: hypothetical protein JWQ76_2082 [Ramlibacter sp.]|nr:hypothetical protein [Ramlibacter sp.]